MYSEIPTKLPPLEQLGEQKIELPSTKQRIARRFIPPIPLGWFQRACRLPGKAPVLAAVIYYRWKVTGSKPFVLTQASLTPFAISRQAKYRALAALEREGLIGVTHRTRRNPEVTVNPEAQ